MYQAEITGTGSYLPEGIISNAELAKRHDISEEWIFERTGIKERRIISPEQSTSDLAYEASLRALENAKLKPEDIDLILLATLTPDQIMPSTACHLQRKLKCRNIMAFDLNAACTGFLYAMSVANQYIKTGLYQNILVVGAEALSVIVNPKDKDTSILFSDGAGVTILSRSSNKDSQFISEDLYSDGQLTNIFNVPGGGSLLPHGQSQAIEDYSINMEGQKLFIHATRTLREVLKNCLEKNQLSPEEIDWVIPHQANFKIIEAVADSLKFPREKILNNIKYKGNTSSGTIPILMDELVEKGTIQKGEKLLFIAFGAGFTSGSILLTY